MTKNIIFMLVCTTFYMSTQGMDSTTQQQEESALQHVEQAEAILTDAKNVTDAAGHHLDDVQVLIKRLNVQERKMIDSTYIAIVVTMVALLVLCATIIERVHWEKSKAEKELEEEEVVPLTPSKAIEPKNS